MMKCTNVNNSTFRKKISRRSALKTAAVIAASSILPGSCRKEPSALANGIYDTIVIGGGFSGLIAALYMMDHNVLLLEKEKNAGGRIVNGTWGDFNYGLGAAYMGKPTLDMRLFFKLLGVKPIPVPPPGDAIANNGTIYSSSQIARVLGSKKAFADYVRMGKKLHEFTAVP